MIKLLLFNIYIKLFLNRITLSFLFKNFDNNNYNYDFKNVIFEDLDDLKKILFSTRYYNSKYYDEKSQIYHSFDWLVSAKKIGGAKSISAAKKQIINWQNKRYSKNSFVWNDIYTTKRLTNLIYNFDFYAISSTKIELEIFKNIIREHYLILEKMSRFLLSENISFETIKVLLLFKLANKIEINKIINILEKQIQLQIDENGFHKTNNPSYQAEIINEFHEIKNILLFFNLKVPNTINLQISNMTSVLLSMLHKDNSIAFFNGANNANINNILKVINLTKNIKSKLLSNIDSGIATYDNKKLKIFFDIVKPINKKINQNLHAGTLSFELSFDDEKIITNCGSIEKRFGKKPEYLRYSAAHSTIIVSNTNISELVEKKSYKRIPEIIMFKSQEDTKKITWSGSHDGYRSNFNRIVKRKITILKSTNKIFGEDSVIATKKDNRKISYNIRFHLTPGCSCLLTNNFRKVLIKTKKNQSWIFESNSAVNIEDSICINDGKKIEKTKQLVISNYSDTTKKSNSWTLTKT